MHHDSEERQKAAIRRILKSKRIGELAIIENLMTTQQVCWVAQAQLANPKLRFCEAAILLGFLTEEDKDFLIGMQKRYEETIEHATRYLDTPCPVEVAAG